VGDNPPLADDVDFWALCDSAAEAAASALTIVAWLVSAGVTAERLVA